MKKILFALMLLLTGCGKLGQPQNLNEFAPIVNQFVADATAHGRTVDISHLIIEIQPVHPVSREETTTTLEVEPGNCDLSIDGPTITIWGDVWNTLDSGGKESLVYHELGHCLLFRVHNSNLDANKNPVSVMWPATLSGDVYEKNRASYLDELFNP